MKHDDYQPRTTKKKRKPVPAKDRKRMCDCEVGDVVRFGDGTRAVVTSIIGSSRFGRYLTGDGDEVREGEFTLLGDSDRPVTLES